MAAAAAKPPRLYQSSRSEMIDSRYTLRYHTEARARVWRSLWVGGWDAGGVAHRCTSHPELFCSPQMLPSLGDFFFTYTLLLFFFVHFKWQLQTDLITASLPLLPLPSPLLLHGSVYFTCCFQICYFSSFFGQTSLLTTAILLTYLSLAGCRGSGGPGCFH